MIEQTENKFSEEQEERIDTFEKILELTEDLPLTHANHMSVEDVIREMISIMPEGWTLQG